MGLLSNAASEALGLGDVAQVVPASDFDKVDADDYVLHEDGEQIYFLIKSKRDEYCFTDRALIHVDGATANSSKRTLKRYSYAHHSISNVRLETAGTVDIDAEIKFMIGEEVLSVDVRKDDIEQLKDLYKALLAIADTLYNNARQMELAHESAQLAASGLQGTRVDDTTTATAFKGVSETAFNWLQDNRDRYVIHDFSDIFERYIQN